MPFRCLAPDDPDWPTLVDRSWRADFYHLAGYHRLAEQGGQRARLLAWQEGDDHLALPLVLRPIPGRAGALDATSVYGYCGPIASRPDPPAEALARFRQALAGYLAERGVVSLFTRLHPLIPQHGLLAGLGECRRLGATVSIDLTAAADERRRGYRTNHRRDIRRLEARGIRCGRDERWTHFDAFERLYRETLDRLGADGDYYFDGAELRALRRVEGGGAELFVCLDGGEVACAGIALRYQHTVGYHLSGTAERFVGQAPLKLLLDGMAAWGATVGAKRLHLGGGLGGRRDGLFHFKRGFSDCEHDFRVWRWVIARENYAELCRAHGRDPDDPYFPAYRAGGGR